jgi:crossover junction endodeoxyribonuclease RusA
VSESSQDLNAHLARQRFSPGQVAQIVGKQVPPPLSRRLVLPWPPSVNPSCHKHVLTGKNVQTGYYQLVLIGKRPQIAITKAGWQFRERVEAAARANRAGTFAGRLVLTGHCYQPNNLRRDLDNILKALFDSLTHAAVWEDDSQVWELHLYKHDPQPDHPRVEVEISVQPGNHPLLEGK